MSLTRREMIIRSAVALGTLAMAPVFSGLVVAAGTLQNVELKRLFTQEEILQVRQKAAKLRTAYTPPGG